MPQQDAETVPQQDAETVPQQDAETVPQQETGAVSQPRKSGDESPHSQSQNLMIPCWRSCRASVSISIIAGVYRQPRSPPSDALPMQGLVGSRR